MHDSVNSITNYVHAPFLPTISSRPTGRDSLKPAGTSTSTYKGVNLAMVYIVHSTCTHTIQFHAHGLFELDIISLLASLSFSRYHMIELEL